ncbi:MAG TPA: response regulator [Nitrososphaeraceae archaeon]|jgi:DNA-binding response OmpR family regulator|nr:response regulator [Nitrososphaeraceae archaeon]
MQEKRILIVDDEPDVNLALRIVLEDNNFIVDSFNDPLRALENFKADMYDLAILDIKMPKKDGFEVYKEILKIDNRVKVCFLTAGDINYRSLKETFPTLDENQFIRKPIENIELIKQIYKIINFD